MKNSEVKKEKVEEEVKELIFFIKIMFIDGSGQSFAANKYRYDEKFIIIEYNGDKDKNENRVFINMNKVFYFIEESFLFNKK